MTWQKGPPAKDVTDSQTFVQSVGGVEVAFARTSDGLAVGFENLCSHADRPLNKGHWDPLKGTIQCPFHRASFDVLQGGKPLGPPAFAPITVYPTKEEDGFVWVSLD